MNHPQMREGRAAYQSAGARCYLPGTLYFLAEVQAKAGQPGEGLTTLAEAFALVEQTDERREGAHLLERADAGRLRRGRAGVGSCR